jgi:imidazolonepropionase
VSTPESITADLVICRLAQLATPGGETGKPLRGADLGEVEVHDGDMWIAAYAGEIVAVGHGYEVRERLDLDDSAIIIDAPGLVAVPGLIDCHTHACFAGDRVAEFELRCRGASYEEIHASGGGILSTVRDTREATHYDLVTRTRRHLAGMLEHGATTVEVKSGYGLDAETEIDMLRAIQEAGYESAVHVTGTCLAAHAVPAEAESADDYIKLCIDEILPEVVEWSLAEAVDVFCERGAFDVDQSRRYLESAREHALALRLHGDQFAEIGALELAIELEARSLDHLEATGQKGIAKLAESGVVGVALPTAALTLGRPLPPARALIDAGGLLALATDFNPGSSPCDSLPAVMHLACTQCHLSPAEALSAVTVNAAHVLGIGERAGRLRVGQRADITLLDVPDWRYLAYRLGSEGVKHVIVEGVWALEG